MLIQSPLLPRRVQALCAHLEFINPPLLLLQCSAQAYSHLQLTPSPALALQPDSGVVTCSTHLPGLARLYRTLRQTGSSHQTDEEHTPPAGEKAIL